MYELFSDRARKVMELANQEAKRFSHEYIGTEHILLGIAKCGPCGAVEVLRRCGSSLSSIKIELESLIQSGPDMVNMGKLPVTIRTKNVIEYAIEESRNLNHYYVETEHILLGLLREREGIAAQVLMNRGLTVDNVRDTILNVMRRKMESLTEADSSEDLAYSPTSTIYVNWVS